MLRRAVNLRHFATAPKQLAPGVQFDTIAREWRFKWSPDNDKAALTAAQGVLDKFSARLKAVKGVKKIQRVVCGGCHDYKVIVALDAAAFGAWDAAKFEPEAEFTAAVSKIPGLSRFETQTYTLMDV